MSKIVFNKITNPESVSLINNNFDKVAEALQNNVLNRKNPLGEPNEMNNDLDMNSYDILNVDTIRAKKVVSNHYIMNGYPDIIQQIEDLENQLNALKESCRVFEGSVDGRFLSVNDRIDYEGIVLGDAVNASRNVKTVFIKGAKMTGVGNEAHVHTYFVQFNSEGSMNEWVDKYKGVLDFDVVMMVTGQDNVYKMFKYSAETQSVINLGLEPTSITVSNDEVSNPTSEILFGDGFKLTELSEITWVEYEPKPITDIRESVNLAQFNQTYANILRCRKDVTNVSSATFTLNLPEGASFDVVTVLEKGSSGDFQSIRRNNDYTFSWNPSNNLLTVTFGRSGSYRIILDIMN